MASKDINGKEIKQGQDVITKTLCSVGWYTIKTCVMKVDGKLYCRGLHGIMPVQHYINQFIFEIEVIR